ncbi:hypothetical protein ATCC90586_001892 [Pythium insidiosum]|nr:hypothetical protein ATCC90586_001892 [Pythium insidiosum]
MGNDASRPLGADGLTPSPGAAAMSPATPRTPSLRTTRSLSSSADPRVDKTIQRMDKAIRKRVRGGITYNMKIIIRGDRGTGKTSLFHRLKGEPIPVDHEATPQLQSATINWSYRANSEESVKCEVWDVVDRGFHPAQDEPHGAPASENENPFERGFHPAQDEPHGAPASENENPFERGALVGSNLRAGSAHPTAATNGAHVVATVDASTVDVYHETHGVVFLLDVTKPHTLEYVRQHLEKVPVHIPTLVLGNFRDCGAQRKIFKEDIQDLLYGTGSTSGTMPRRPTELLYFECSLLNCYGLKTLHQYFGYFGVPFLQLKLHTLRQQMRIVEGDFSHLKLDIQGKIAEQRYADYVEHIKATGSDIRIGRRVSGGVNGSAESPRTAGPRIERTQSSSSDVVISPSAGSNDTNVEIEAGSSANKHQQDLENQDLPERRAAEKLLEQNSSSRGLKIEYTLEEQARSQPTPAATLSDAKNDTRVDDAKSRPAGKDESNVTLSGRPVAVDKKMKTDTKQTVQIPTPPPPVSPKRKRSIDDVMNLEDFQVPKSRVDDLDNFYSEDESDTEEQTETTNLVRKIEEPTERIEEDNLAGIVADKDELDDFLMSDEEEEINEPEVETAMPSSSVSMSQDILAAIRQAEQEAFQMLGDSSAVDTQTRSTASSKIEQEESKPKKKRRDKTKSTRRSTKTSTKTSKSTRRHEILETDESDG